MRHWQPRQHCWHLRNGWQAPQALHRRGRCGERAQQQHDTGRACPNWCPCWRASLQRPTRPSARHACERLRRNRAAAAEQLARVPRLGAHKAGHHGVAAVQRHRGHHPAQPL